MDANVLFPSLNWFKVSILAVSKDNWLVYGGPNKSLCVLEPISGEHNRETQYHAHECVKAHNDRIVSVDISPDWPEKKYLLTGSSNGSVKHWYFDKSEVDKFKPNLSHDVHFKNNEEVVGVAYSNNIYAITVGVSGNIVRWDITTNAVKTIHPLRNFKPVCMACSRHLPLNVAVGTKQGVVFVLDLTGPGKIIFKVRGQDEEIVNVSWCPQFEVAVKKAATKTKNKGTKTANKLDVNKSATEKDLPEDSFDDSVVVQEDDMFDIYKDHENDEFGHKKYEPEDIIVKVPAEEKHDDYLAECLKLKEEILRRKTTAESSMESLVEAMDKAHVDDNNKNVVKSDNENSTTTEEDNAQQLLEEGFHSVQKHLFATMSKYGNVRIWSMAGKLLGTYSVANKLTNVKMTFYPTLLWYKPDVLLMSDAKCQLIQCNPLDVDSKNTIACKVVHSIHKRPVYCIASGAPRVTTESKKSDSGTDWPIWTAAQDRYLVQYSLETGQELATHHTCGGYVYNIAPCPYDASKIAVAVGDGSVKLIELETQDDHDEYLFKVKTVTNYWQNVQGKVLIAAWHPSKENFLAFATAEARVGLLDTTTKVERPAKLLDPIGMTGGIYALVWGGHRSLYVCACRSLFVYNIRHEHTEPEKVRVVVEGQEWAVTAISRVYSRSGNVPAASRSNYEPALTVGSEKGGVCVLSHAPHYNVLAAVFVACRMIYTINWHPTETTDAPQGSQYKNLLAVTSINKENHIVILEYVKKEDDNNQLVVWKTLVGHVNAVYDAQWNPHREGILLSTSLDHTARMWDVQSGDCLAVYGQQQGSVLCARWAQDPRLVDVALSGGADCGLRGWRAARHPPRLAGLYERKPPSKKSAKNTTAKLQKQNQEMPMHEEEFENEYEIAQVAVIDERGKNKFNRRFLMPISFREIVDCDIQSVKIMLQQYLEKNSMDNIHTITQPIEPQEEEENEEDYVGEEEDTETPYSHTHRFLKMFGSINDVNKLLDMELKRHTVAKSLEAYVVLCMLRGHIDTLVQYACQHEVLCPYIVSLAPCVSFKYWKDVCQLYITQLNRVNAKGNDDKFYEHKIFGGSVYRKATMQLCVHDVKGAVETLVEASCYKEAYILCRIRYMDNIAEDTLKRWAYYSKRSGQSYMTAVCYIALGDLVSAANTLACLVKNEECLQLAADIAKITGQNIFAEHVSKKREEILSVVNNEKEATASDQTDEEETLDELPTRAEALMSNGDDV